MSLAMCLWVMEHSFKSLERLEKQNKVILNSWMAGSSLPSTTVTQNSNGAMVKNTEKPKENVKNKPVINQNHVAYRNVQDPRGQYSWLFGGMR